MNPAAVPAGVRAHRWDLTPTEAIALQRQLAGQVETQDRLIEPVRLVAGVDVGFPDRQTTRAVIALLRFPELDYVGHAEARVPTSFPYVPGLLSFRELPAILAAWQQLTATPQLLLVDGHGIAHPRRLGIAAHLGLVLDRPTIGVGKSRLCGEWLEPPDEKGCWSPLRERGETIGAVLRTRRGVRPVIVSPGHRISLASAIDYTRRCLGRYRLPETTRWADRLASRGPRDH